MTLITREEAARRLGVAASYIQGRLQKTLLHPIRDERGRVFFEESDVAHALSTWTRKRFRKIPVTEDSANVRLERGRIAAMVFLILEEGGNYHDCVMLTAGDPVWVREFYEDWHVSPEERKSLKAIHDEAEYVAKRQVERAKLEIQRDRARVRLAFAEAQKARAQRGEAPEEDLVGKNTAAALMKRLIEADYQAQKAEEKLKEFDSKVSPR